MTNSAAADRFLSNLPQLRPESPSSVPSTAKAYVSVSADDCPESEPTSQSSINQDPGSRVVELGLGLLGMVVVLSLLVHQTNV